MFYKDERLALFIDGSNLYSAAKSLGFEVDFRKLREEFIRRGRMLRAIYYTALPENEEYSPIKPLVDWLNYNGFLIVTRPVREFIDVSGNRRIKGNIDVHIAVDTLNMAPHIDHAVLFSGNGDFKPLVASLQSKGLRVSAVSTVRSAPPMIADDLRRQVDNFIELDDLKEVIGRSPRADFSKNWPSPETDSGMSDSKSDFGNMPK